jgi:hypothetical protein
MVGAVVGLCCVALVGFAVGMGIGTNDVGVCWDLLQVQVGAIKGDTGMALSVSSRPRVPSYAIGRDRGEE